MKSFNGLMLTDACYAEGKALKKQGNFVWFVRPEGGLGITRCDNCCDTGDMFIKVGSGVNRKYIKHVCPLCNPDDESSKVDQLLIMSGLQLNEQNWQTDFAAIYDGKCEAINSVETLMKEALYPKGLISLFGSYGVGKSGLLKAIVANFCKKGVQARYVRASDILSEARDTFGKNNSSTEERESDILRKYRSYQLLAIDEIDRISKTDWATSFIFSLLDERYNLRNHRATLLASNMIPGNLPQGFEYLEDRLKDGTRIIMAGPSLRGNQSGTLAKRKES